MSRGGDTVGKAWAFAERVFFAAVRRPVTFVERRVVGALVERRLGIATDAIIDGEELGYTERETNPYEPSEWRTLKRAFPPDSVSPADVFVDIGSGLGRAVLFAAELPFKRVIGVELSPELHAAALANLARARIKRPEAVEFVCADAREYELPDDVTVVFVCNPFNGEIFDAAMARVFASYDRAPRRLRIVYRLPRDHDRLMATGRVHLISQLWDSRVHAFPRQVGIATYEVAPAAVPAPRT